MKIIQLFLKMDGMKLIIYSPPVCDLIATIKVPHGGKPS